MVCFGFLVGLIFIELVFLLFGKVIEFCVWREWVMFDILIKGGMIVDGFGGKLKIGDIVIKDGWIVEVGGMIIDYVD